jgi:hypothetical protein
MQRGECDHRWEEGEGVGRSGIVDDEMENAEQGRGATGSLRPGRQLCVQNVERSEGRTIRNNSLAPLGVFRCAFLRSSRSRWPGASLLRRIEAIARGKELRQLQGPTCGHTSGGWSVPGLSVSLAQPWGLVWRLQPGKTIICQTAASMCRHESVKR